MRMYLIVFGQKRKSAVEESSTFLFCFAVQEVDASFPQMRITLHKGEEKEETFATSPHSEKPLSSFKPQ